MFLTHTPCAKHTLWLLLFSDRVRSRTQKRLECRLKCPVSETCKPHDNGCAYCWVNNVFMHSCRPLSHSAARRRRRLCRARLFKQYCLLTSQPVPVFAHDAFFFPDNFWPRRLLHLRSLYSPDQIYIMTNAYLKIRYHFVYTYTNLRISISIFGSPKVCLNLLFSISDTPALSALHSQFSQYFVMAKPNTHRQIVAESERREIVRLSHASFLSLLCTYWLLMVQKVVLHNVIQRKRFSQFNQFTFCRKTLALCLVFMPSDQF